MPTVEAAGAIVYRFSDKLPSACHSLSYEELLQYVEVCLVHRPHHADWTWPKGKLKAHETSRHAAVREVLEETGISVRLLSPLGESLYPLVAEGSADKDRYATEENNLKFPVKHTMKHVKYWIAEAVGETERYRRRQAFGIVTAALPDEIDDVVWLSVSEAYQQLTYQIDKQLLKKFEYFVLHGICFASTLLLVRHGKAEARKNWDGGEYNRPLTPYGASSSFALNREIACYAPQRLLSSPWQRCVSTLQPYQAATGLPLVFADNLTEAQFECDNQLPVQCIADEVQRLSLNYLAAIESTHAAHAIDLLGLQDDSECSNSHVLQPSRSTVLCMHRPVFASVLPYLASLCLTDDIAQTIPTKSPYFATGEGMVFTIVYDFRRKCPVVIETEYLAPIVY